MGRRDTARLASALTIIGCLAACSEKPGAGTNGDSGSGGTGGPPAQTDAGGGSAGVPSSQGGSGPVDGGATGGSGGATHGDAGATANVGGTAGIAGGVNSGGVAGGIGTLGQPCSPTGAYACAGHAQRGQLVCRAGYWDANGTCLAANNCDTSEGNAGFCNPIVSECSGQVAGASFCRDADRFECGIDLVTAERIETCPYLCTDGTCTGECNPGERDCSGGGSLGAGRVPRTCQTDSTWLDGAPCAYLCDPTTATCIAPTCVDGVKNGDETDVDCGGTCGATCAVNQTCSLDTDCEVVTSGKCGAGSCAIATCSDSAKNGTETDVDCGGSCTTRCSVGSRCAVDSDCVLPGSGKCARGRCAAASCSDLVKNGSETDVDCGGSCGTGCGAGKSCSAGSDCASGICAGSPGVCQSPSCTDGIKNGTETDVDCGSNCTGCADGEGCARNADCKQGVCSSTTKTCQPDNGYLVSGTWQGYVWTAVAGSGSTIAPPDFSNVPSGGPFCASGTIRASAQGFAMIGWNLNEAQGSVVIGTVTPVLNGVRLSLSNTQGTPLRLQLMDGSSIWCANVTGTGGFIPYSSFSTACSGGSGTSYAFQPISQIGLVALGSSSADVPFNFCLNGIADAAN